MSRRRVTTAVVLVVVAVVWVFVNKPVEGPTLLTIGPYHGITVGDLLSVALVLVAVAIVLPWRRRARRH